MVITKKQIKGLEEAIRGAEKSETETKFMRWIMALIRKVYEEPLTQTEKMILKEGISEEELTEEEREFMEKIKKGYG